MSKSTNRRSFVRTLALGASAGLIAPAPSPAGPPDDERPDPIEAEVDARMQLILARYGESLDEDSRRRVRSQVEGVVRRGRSLRRHELDNGEGPFPLFTPYRAPLG